MRDGSSEDGEEPDDLGGNPKESKPQVGTTRQQNTNRRDQQRNLGTSTTPARPNPGGVQDTEMGPCRKHLDSVLRQLQTEIFRGSQTLYVPNCDHRGFYRKRQCRSSQGQRRGPCWCVDRMGQPLPASADSNGGSPCSAGSSG
ncbi:Insulin-like growth factor-binding protein 6 [Myotis brandtii]|uniref:Insulin-like growth factor-binding protein 6 n=1 Tax=Myotis brandtii TaxID=109478 RepID=S7MYF1_MYOBR|nr:Insulin-like growth factor-binding protein 6 [Myotis brandtii]